MSRVQWTSPVFILGLVVVVHVLLAIFIAWPSVHTGGDNAAYVSLAQSLARDGAYSELWHPGAPPHTRYPPLYPGFLALLILLGAKTWGILKASSILFTAAATAFCFLWVRRVHGVPVAALAALLFGISPAVLFHTQWILAEPLFLALTFGCLWALTPDSPQARRRPLPANGPDGVSRASLAAGLGLAVAAYFTRSAGLPLIAAVAIWLALGRRWSTLAVLGVVFAMLAVPWQLRSGGEYASAFWMLNPHAPDLGTAGPGDLVQRVGQNLREYSLEHVPTGLSGMTGTLGAAFGVVLAACVVVGWFRRARHSPGVAEIFFPLYTGLILVWPVQWSGDRFVLPLLPLVLLYAGETVAWGASRVFRRPAWIVAVAAALVAVPAVDSWTERADQANQCRVRVATLGPMGCYASHISEFQAMALWARTGLPEGSTVFTRKPRLFYAFSGHASVTYPFTDDGQTLLTQADSLGVGYVVAGNWDFSGPAYVNPVIQANPERFCLVAQLTSEAGSPISLLAITAPTTDDDRGGEAGGEPSPTEVQLATCLADDWGTPPSAAALASMTIPILERR